MDLHVLLHRRLQLVDLEMVFREAGGGNPQAFDNQFVLPKIGADFNYALLAQVSAKAFAEYGHNGFDDIATGHFGMALIYRPVRAVELSARLYTLNIKLKSDQSDLRIRNNGTALGLKLNF